MAQIVKSFLYEPETAIGTIELALKNLEVKGHVWNCNCSEVVTGGSSWPTFQPMYLNLAGPKSVR